MRFLFHFSAVPAGIAHKEMDNLSADKFPGIHRRRRSYLSGDHFPPGSLQKLRPLGNVSRMVNSVLDPGSHNWLLICSCTSLCVPEMDNLGNANNTLLWSANCIKASAHVKVGAMSTPRMQQPKCGKLSRCIPKTYLGSRRFHVLVAERDETSLFCELGGDSNL